MEHYSRIGNGAHESKERKRSMRGPKSTCFKILTCSRKDPVEDDDDNSIISIPKNKALSDKRKRGFRKQSTRGHQVPSNSTTLDLGFVHHNRESREEITSSDGFHSRKSSGFHSRKSSGSQSRKSSSIPENAPVQDIIKETAPLSSTFLNSEITVPLIQPDINPSAADERPPKNFVVIIQAAMRGYLARRELYKAKNAVKLQAAVRGHLVRRQAVGTLLCTHAICKVQALVRARRARQLSEGFAEAAKDAKLNMYMESPDFLAKRNACNHQDRRYSSTVKLLSNGFARQLLESTTKIKPIYISCDPSKSDSAWKWLERWMAVTTSGWQHHEHNYDEIFKEREGSSNLSDHETGNEDISAAHSIMSTSELAPSKSLLPNEDEADSITNTSASFKLHSPASFLNNCASSSLGQDDGDKSQIENDAIDTRQENDTNAETLAENYVSLYKHIRLHPGETSQSLPSSLCDKTDSDSDKVNNNRMTSCESLETEGNGSRKPFDPAFPALQSNSEGLRSTSVMDKFVDLSYNDATNDSSLHIPQSLVDPSTKTKHLDFADNPLTHNPTLAVTASECGTETSIYSTLDPHGFPEPEVGKVVLEVGRPEKQNSVGSDISFIGDAEAEGPSSELDVFQPDRSVKEDTNVSSHKSVVADVPFIGNAEAKESYSKLEVFHPERLVQEDTNLSIQKSVNDDVALIGNAETKESSSKLEFLWPEDMVKDGTNLLNKSVGADLSFIGDVEAKKPSSKLGVTERLVNEDTNSSNPKSVGADVPLLGKAEAKEPSSKLEVLWQERLVKEGTNLSLQSVGADVPFIGNVEAKEPSSKLEVLQQETLVDEDTNLSNKKSVGADVPLIGKAEAKEPSSELEILWQERLVKEDTNLSHQSVDADVPSIENVEAKEPCSKLEALQLERLVKEDTNLLNQKSVGADALFFGNAEANQPSFKLEVLQPERLLEEDTNLSDEKFVGADVSSRNAEVEEPSSKLEVLAPGRLKDQDTNLTNQQFVDSDVPHVGNAEAENSSSKLEVFQPERPKEKDRNLDDRNFIDAHISNILNAIAEDPSSKLEILQPESLEEEDTSLHNHNFVGADVSFTGNAEVQDPSSKLEVLQSKRLERANTDNQNFVDADVSFIGNSDTEDPSSKLEVLQPERLEEKDRNISYQNFVDADVSLTGNAEAEDPSSKLKVLQPERMEEEDTNLSNENFVDAADISFNGNTEKDYPSSKEEEDKYQANKNFVGANVAFIGNAEAEELSSKSEAVKSERSEEEITDISSPTSSVEAMQVIQHSPENFIKQQVESTSPEETPQSHTTTSELIGTTSNKDSVNSSEDKKDRSIRSGKQRLQTSKKPPPSNAKNDLNFRVCMEQLEKDSKSAKRRNSFGAINYVDGQTEPGIRSSNGDPEPGIRSSNSLPSYMQATKSAMAKVQTNISTKPSPDAHEKDNLMNKRHSLPVANGKQGFVASRVQQHELKGSGGTTYSRLNSTDRRWQR